MLQSIIRNNTTLSAVGIFIVIFIVIHIIQPPFLYNTDGTIREFGLGYKNKTILPLWLFSIILGILSYVFVLFYST